MPPCFGMGAFFWRARLRFALASCGALAIAREAERSEAFGGRRAGASRGVSGANQSGPRAGRGVPVTSRGGPFRTGSDPAGHMKRKTMSAHFATAPYTVPVNVNGV